MYRALRVRSGTNNITDYELALRLDAVSRYRKNGIAEFDVDGERILLPRDDGNSRWEKIMKGKRHDSDPAWIDSIEAAERGDYAGAWAAIFSMDPEEEPLDSDRS